MSDGYKRIITSDRTVRPRPISDLSQDRLFPRQVGTGIMRGTQGVGTVGGVNIDSSGNRITVGNITLDGTTGTVSTSNTDGSKVGLGIIPGSTNEFGFFATDQDGTLVMKVVNGTLYTYNVDTGDNVIQIGKLTNGEYGGAFAKDGDDLVEALVAT